MTIDVDGSSPAADQRAIVRAKARLAMTTAMVGIASEHRLTPSEEAALLVELASRCMRDVMRHSRPKR